MYFRSLAARYSTAGHLVTEEDDPLAAFQLAIESYRSPGIQAWFYRLSQEHNIDHIYLSYAVSDGIVDHTRLGGLPRIIDTHDLWSLQLSMRHAVAQHLHGQHLDPSSFDVLAIDEQFFTRLNLQPNPEELRILAQYDQVITLSRFEEAIMRSRIPANRLVYMPTAFDVVPVCNTYSGSAYFPVGPHVFNVQGYAYFVRRVLPDVIRQVPDFSLETTGTWYRDAQPVASVHVTHRGFVHSITAMYQDARLMIAPTLGGTGQAVKILEAMAHGMPVVATAAAARESPLEHGHNGFVAETATEFADYTCRLWHDRDLCRRFGQAARDTIEQRFSVGWLANQVGALFTVKRPGNKLRAYASLTSPVPFRGRRSF